MKNNFFIQILSIFFLLFQCSSFIITETPTDLKEYGLNGKVKVRKSYVYTDLEQKKGKWIIDNNKHIAIWEMFFNKKGGLDSIKESIRGNGNEWESFITIYNHENGKKNSYFKKNSKNEILEKGKYEWLNNYNYILTTESKDYKIRFEANLNQKFRDLSGSYAVIVNDSIYYAESYINKLANDWEILSSEYTNIMTNERYHIDLKNKKTDAKNNFIQIASVFRETGKLKRLKINEIEYY